MIEINEALAKKVIETVDHGLCFGLGVPTPGKMCIEAAVNFAMGMPHGDQPLCVGPAVRKFKIRLNDSNRWKTEKSRAAGLRRLAVAQLGSNTIDQKEFSKLLVLRIIQQLLPKLLREVSKREDLTTACEKAKTLEEAKTAAYAAANAAYAAANAAANAYAANAAVNAANAADAAAYAAANAAVDAADAAAAAAYAANAAAYAANAADAAAYAADAADAAANAATKAKIDPESYLVLAANICESVLKDLKSPGCEFLSLLD